MRRPSKIAFGNETWWCMAVCDGASSGFQSRESFSLPFSDHSLFCFFSLTLFFSFPHIHLYSRSCECVISSRWDYLYRHLDKHYMGTLLMSGYTTNCEMCLILIVIIPVTHEFYTLT